MRIRGDVRRVAHGGHVARFLDDVERGHDRGVEPLEQAAHQRHVELLGELHQVLGVGQPVGERLLHEQRQPLVEDLPAELVVRLGGRRDDHGVDAAETVEVRTPGRVEPLGHGLAVLPVGVDDVREVDLVGLGGDACVQRAHGAGADDGQPQWCTHAQAFIRSRTVATTVSTSSVDRPGCTGSEMQRLVTELATGTSDAFTLGSSR